MKSGIKLSVICITYNHAGFIRQALDGFVMQKTNFPFEVIVHDDASTDETAKIIREYEIKYPELIKPIYQKENLWNKEESASKDYIYPMIRGKYVALCEGDDYWTDPLKLQKQVDFLEANPDHSICFHPVLVHWEDNRSPDSYYPTKKQIAKIKDFNLKKLLKQNFIQTNSVVYRWRINNENSEIMPTKILPADWFLHLLHAQVGKIGFLPEVMATYRRHSNGIWTGAWVSDEWYSRCGLAAIRFYAAVEKQFKVCKKREMRKVFVKTFCAAIRQNDENLICSLQKNFPNVLEQVLATKFVNTKVKIYSLLKKVPWSKCQKKANNKIERINRIKMIIDYIG